MRLNDLVFLILNYNNYELTINAVNNILSFNLDSIIVVVDNNSNNDSYNKIVQTFSSNPEVITVRNKYNAGYAAGNNFGFSIIRELNRNINSVIVMNPDITVPSKEVIYELYASLNRQSDYAILSTKVRMSGQMIYPNECAWKYLTKRQLLLRGSLLGLLFKSNIYYDNMFDKPIIYPVDIVQGCFFIVDFHSLEKAGFFDEQTFLYGEEDILSVRMSRINKKSGILGMYYIEHSHEEKNKNLQNYENKCFDSDCYHNSRLVYINNYLECTVLFRAFANIYIRTDAKLKKLFYRLIYRK